jgi:predicted anti-sigma-YlaC factor YlaD
MKKVNMGTSTGSREDPVDMNCGTAREAMSALLDGEALPCARKDLDTHVAACHECEQWQEAAHLVTRRARLTPAPSVPDNTERILTAVLADRPPGRRGRPTVRLVRCALAATALAHGVIIIPALVGWAVPTVPPHAARELAAFNLTLAVALLAAAARPAWARAMLPVVGVATGFLALLALVDTASGYTTLHAEAPHLITLLGAVLLALLTRRSGGDTDGPAQRPLRRQPRLRTLWRRRLPSGLAGSVRIPARGVAWKGAQGSARVFARTAPAGADTESAEDDNPDRRVA